MLINIEGLEVEINETAFDNMEVMDLLVEVDSGDPLAFSKLLNYVFTPAEKKKVYDFCREDDGRVTLEKFMPVWTEIMSQAGKHEKNS